MSSLLQQIRELAENTLAYVVWISSGTKPILNNACIHTNSEYYVSYSCMIFAL